LIIFQFIFEIFTFFILFFKFLLKTIFLFLALKNPYIYSLRNLSSFGNQIYQRLQYIKFMRLNQLKFHETSFRFLCDIVIGVLTTLFLSRKIEYIQISVLEISFFFKNYFIAHIDWLIDGWPGGLKLNENLSSFLGKMILATFENWLFLVQLFNIQWIIYFTLASGIFGISFLISMIRDILGVMSSFIFFFYILFSKIYSSQLNAITSFWRFFRGWKYNKLRDRMDACDYSSSQMILGTILFTLLVFLFPTISVYYFSFTMFRILINFVQNLLGMVVEMFNIFPIYFCLLKFFNPSNMTTGFYLEYVDKDEGMIYFNMKKKLISYSKIIKYERDWSIFDWNILEILKKILVGKILPRVLFVSSNYLKKELNQKDFSFDIFTVFNAFIHKH
jgi:hypothetical protein